MERSLMVRVDEVLSRLVETIRILRRELKQKSVEASRLTERTEILARSLSEVTKGSLERRRKLEALKARSDFVRTQRGGVIDWLEAKLVLSNTINARLGYIIERVDEIALNDHSLWESCEADSDERAAYAKYSNELANNSRERTSAFREKNFELGQFYASKMKDARRKRDFYKRIRLESAHVGALERMCDDLERQQKESMTLGQSLRSGGSSAPL